MGSPPAAPASRRRLPGLRLLGGCLATIVIVQYVTFARTGTVYWTDGWLYLNPGAHKARPYPHR